MAGSPCGSGSCGSIESCKETPIFARRRPLSAAAMARLIAQVIARGPRASRSSRSKRSIGRSRVVPVHRHIGDGLGPAQGLGVEVRIAGQAAAVEEALRAEGSCIRGAASLG